VNRRTTLALSGPDNVGKSRQLRILARRCGPDLVVRAGALHDHDGRWKSIAAGGMASWWFKTSSPGELADVLASSYLARHEAAPGSGPLLLVDRGVPMLEATLAATLATRQCLDDQRAYDQAMVLLRPYEAGLRSAEAQEFGVLLLHAEEVADNARLSLAREVRVSDVYGAYQGHLARQIARLADAGRFAHTVDPVGHSRFRLRG